VWIVRRLLATYPHITAGEWSKVISSGQDMFNCRDDDSAAKAAELRRTLGIKYPGIFDYLPEVGSVEHRMLEVAAK
jgi:hypothetical protein